MFHTRWSLFKDASIPLVNFFSLALLSFSIPVECFLFSIHLEFTLKTSFYFPVPSFFVKMCLENWSRLKFLPWLFVQVHHIRVYFHQKFHNSYMSYFGYVWCCWLFFHYSHEKVSFFLLMQKVSNVLFLLFQPLFCVIT